MELNLPAHRTGPNTFYSLKVIKMKEDFALRSFIWSKMSWILISFAVAGIKSSWEWRISADVEMKTSQTDDNSQEAMLWTRSPAQKRLFHSFKCPPDRELIRFDRTSTMFWLRTNNHVQPLSSSRTLIRLVMSYAGRNSPPQRKALFFN